MKSKVRRSGLTLLVLAAMSLCSLSFCARRAIAQTQDQHTHDQQAQDQQQRPSTGPKPDVGETVIVPKKAQPAPAKPENKPEKINPNDIYTITTSTNLVNVDVMVTDKNGNPIASLGRTNFKVYDDGVPQAVTNFGAAEAPMTVCLMVEFANRWWPFLYLALEDSYQFLNFMQPKDWVAVIDFDMKPHILQDFTQDRYEVRGALDTLRIPGFSEINLWDALAFTIDRMKDIKGRKAIVVVCTGFDTFSKLTYDQALKIAKASDTAIYPVSILEFVTVRRGESILFVHCPGIPHPVRVTGEYLAERSRWAIVACEGCGADQSLDPPSVMARTRFPNAPAGATPVAFTAICPCGGTMTLCMVTSAAQTQKEPVARVDAKPWWKLW